MRQLCELADAQNLAIELNARTNPDRNLAHLVRQVRDSTGSITTASAEIGPSTRAQISAMTSAMFRPDLAISDGLVVTPSTIPVGTMSLMTATSAVSRKSFMAGVLAEAGRS